MTSVSLKTDFKETFKSLNRLSDDLQKRVVPAALNKVVAKANTEMVRAITSEFNIKADEVRSNLKIIKAKRDFSKWVAQLDPFAKNRKGRGFNLVRFVEKKVTLAEGRRRAKAGTLNQVQFQIKKLGGKKIIKGAFIGNNGKTVFIREGNDRLPIKPVTTIDVSQMFNTRRINKRVMDRINSELPIEFDRAIKAAIAGAIR